MRGLAEALLTGVPEAAIKKNRDLEVGKVDVGSAHHIGRAEFPSTNAMGPKQCCHTAFRGLVTAPPNP